MRAAAVLAALLSLAAPAVAGEAPSSPRNGRSADAAMDRLLSRDAGEEPVEARDAEPTFEECRLGATSRAVG